MIVRQRAFSRLRLADWDAVALRESGQRAGGIRIVHAAARDDQRVPRLRDQSCRLI